MLSKDHPHELKSLGILGLIALLAMLMDGIWLALDHAIPSWDPADHLIGALNYEWMLRNAHWFSRDWWTGIWTLSSKYPPLLYASTAPILRLLGPGADQSILVNWLYTTLLLVSIYGLGRHLFSVQVGLWAAGLCLLFPQFYSLRTQYFMDYPLTALVAASIWFLTLWRDAKRPLHQWLFALGFGAWFGLALLMKQTALFFLVVPVVWITGQRLGQRAWMSLVQLLSGLLISLGLMFPWSRTNWLFQISAAFTANTRSAEIEGDPSITSPDAWTYYWQSLPEAISYPLLIVPIVGLLLGFTLFSGSQGSHSSRERRSLRWLLIVLLGAYVIWSAFANKDVRYIMPWLPVWAIALAYGITRFPHRWRGLRWATVGVAIALLLLNLFPMGGAVGRTLAQTLAPSAQHLPYLGAEWPHEEIIQEIIQAQPYQIATLGVLPSTPEVNQHNLTYYGNRENFQVYARRMGDDRDMTAQDVRSLSWFLSVTRPQLNHHEPNSRERQKDFVRRLRDSPDFEKYRSWTLPDGSRLDLFHRAIAPVEVQPISDAADAVQLVNLTVPTSAPPGNPIPVTYEWSGSWRELHDGMVLLTWEHGQNPDEFWLHDHGLGLGTLHPKPIQANQTIFAEASVAPNQPFKVVERTAMLPPEDAVAGAYTLRATYLNPNTGETYPIAGASGTIQIDPTAVPLPAPELDWVTQLRTWATALPDGTDALDPVFEQLGRINLYDPVQNYTVQAEQTLAYRFQESPENLDYAYGLALSNVLQRDVNDAIAAFETITRLDSENPYAYAYLAFVNLYDLRPGAAQNALQPALELNPNLAELRVLNAAASLMQGNLIGAWKDGRAGLGS